MDPDDYIEPDDYDDYDEPDPWDDDEDDMTEIPVEAKSSEEAQLAARIQAFGEYVFKHDASQVACFCMDASMMTSGCHAPVFARKTIENFYASGFYYGGNPGDNADVSPWYEWILSKDGPYRDYIDRVGRIDYSGKLRGFYITDETFPKSILLNLSVAGRFPYENRISYHAWNMLRGDIGERAAFIVASNFAYFPQQKQFKMYPLVGSPHYPVKDRYVQRWMASKPEIDPNRTMGDAHSSSGESYPRFSTPSQQIWTTEDEHEISKLCSLTAGSRFIERTPRFNLPVKIGLEKDLIIAATKEHIENCGVSL